MRRTPYSVRFDPYYKVQRWGEISLSWIDVQVSYPTLAEAVTAQDHTPGRTRLMEIREDGRAPVPDSVRDGGST